MKIKLQDYSLISNEILESLDGILDIDALKEQLIPSEKLADVCYSEGFKEFRLGQKQDFLTSEISISDE